MYSGYPKKSAYRSARRPVKIVRRKKTYARAKPSAITSYFPTIPTRGNISKTGVPNTMSVQLKTFETIAVAPGATHIEYAFQLNSANDPFGATSAVQPTGYDQLTALYGSYIVDSGRCRLTFVNTTNAPVIIVAYTSSQAAVAASVNNYASQPGAVYRTCADTESGNVTAIISRSFKSSQILGPLDRSQHGATIAANPTSLAYLYITIYSSSGNVTGALYVDQTQNTTFYDKQAVVHA